MVGETNKGNTAMQESGIVLHGRSVNISWVAEKDSQNLRKSEYSSSTDFKSGLILLNI